MMFFFGRSLAQEDNVSMATSALQEALATLKQSVEKLSLDNDQWTARDKAMKAKGIQLQTQLGQLEAQGNLLNKTADKLRDKNPRRGRQIARLEKENFDLDNRIEKALGGIKLIQQSMASGAHLQKEKLKLMKMIYDSQLRQESLHESILRATASVGYDDRATASVGHDDRATGELTMRVRQLELELKVLEKNYLQFKDLMEQISKRATAFRMTVSGHIEEGKLQSSIDDLNRQGVGLRANLDALLSQMVDLDKRKARLETMAQHLP